ncbi:hypothetical protein VNI00_009387 [Paramarasmius palmivorus]|uniref:MYND-type domain-containing protein n=1 Tax=Paramarasmius palmivorus TaxID=297713 RepID=A0AAW0CRL7_9AGAR
MSPSSREDPFEALLNNRIQENEWHLLFGPTNQCIQIPDIKKSLLRSTPFAVDISFPSKEVQLVVDSLVELLSPANLSQRPPLRRTLRNLWPRVLRWMSFLVERVVLVDVHATTSRGRAIQVNIANLSQRLLELCADPMFESLCNDSKTHSFHFFTAILHIVIHLLENGDPWFQRLFPALKRAVADVDILTMSTELPHKHDLTASSVHALIKANGTPKPDLWSLYAVLRLLKSFSSSEVHLRIIRQYHIVRWLAKTISSLAKRVGTLLPGELKVACANLVLCVEMMKCHIFTGHTWVIEALNEHILPAIAKTKVLDLLLDTVGEPADSPFRLGKPYTKLINTIRPFSLIYSIALRVSRYAQKVARYLQVLNLPSDDPFNEALYSLLREAHMSRQDINRFQMALGRVYCSNVKCSTVIADTGRSPKMKKCSQCRVVVYCSLTCQKDDWKINHREVCSHLQPEHPGDGFRLSEPDAAYIKDTVRRYIAEVRTELLQEKADCEVGVSARSNAVTLTFIYNLWPCKIFFDKASRSLESLNCRHAKDDFRLQWDQLDMSKEILIVVWHPGWTCHSVMVYRESLVNASDI